MDRNHKRAIIAWSFYDWANSAFPTVVITFIFATYFTQAIAPNSIVGTELWGNTIALSALLIAIASPLFGAIADYHGPRKPWLAFFTLLLGISCTLLWFAQPHPQYVYWSLFWIAAANIGFEIGTVFYNAMLKDLAPAHYIGRISGWAWGLGYLGGLFCLVIALVLFVQGNVFHLNTQTSAHLRITGPLVAVWLIIFALPLFIFTSDNKASGLNYSQSIQLGCRQLFTTFRRIIHYKHIVWFLFARMIYIDGLNTLFAFGGIYAAGTFDMGFVEIIYFGITLNVTAGLGAASFAWLDDRIGSKKTILLALAGLIIIGTITLFIHSKLIFWILAIMLGTFVGPAQAASRTLMARIAPKEIVNELFGLYALSGKITSFVGPWLVGMLTLQFNSQRAGMASVILLMLIGGALLAIKVDPTAHK